MCKLGHNVISSPEVVVRTSVQQQIGGYRPELPHTGDAEMWMRFAIRSDVAYVKGVDQAYYRIHASQMTNERVTYVDLVQRKAAYDTLFDAYGDQIPGAARLRRRAGPGDGQGRPVARLPCVRAPAHGHDPDHRAGRVRRRPPTRRPPASPSTGACAGAGRSGRRSARTCSRSSSSAAHRRVRTALRWRRWAREGF